MHSLDLFKLLLIFILCPNIVFAASFSCEKAATFQEKIICSDDELSNLDVELNRIYSKLLKIDSDKDSLRLLQRNWILERDKCIDENCLIEIYESRIRHLSEIWLKTQLSHHLPGGNRLKIRRSFKFCRPEVATIVAISPVFAR